MDLEIKAKPRFLNHEDPRAWFLTDLENGLCHITFIMAHAQSNCGMIIT